MTPTQYQLLQHLCQKACTGPQLGELLGSSRAAIWKQIEQLRRLGVDIQSSDQGYQIPDTFHLLDAEQIRQHLNPPTASLCNAIQILPTTDSTNKTLWQYPDQDRHGRVLLAEWQSAGRGRRGRQWHSPPCGNLYFSLGWQFDCGIGALGLLSTQIALSTAQAIQSCHQIPVQLKWPNDIYLEGRKLGGILIELQATPDGPSAAVIGIGLNLNMPEDAPIDQAFTSLNQHASPVDRNRICAALIQELIDGFHNWPAHDPQQIINRWNKLDYLAGHSVNLVDADHVTAGQYLGIDQQGGVRLSINGEIKHYHSGEVSLRRE